MFKNYFKGIEGIDGYPLFLLIVFFAFAFVRLTFWLFWKADSTKKCRTRRNAAARFHHQRYHTTVNNHPHTTNTIYKIRFTRLQVCWACWRSPPVPSRRRCCRTENSGTGSTGLPEPPSLLHLAVGRVHSCHWIIALSQSGKPRSAGPFRKSPACRRCRKHGCHGISSQGHGLGKLMRSLTASVLVEGRGCHVCIIIMTASRNWTQTNCRPGGNGDFTSPSCSALVYLVSYHVSSTGNFSWPRYQDAMKETEQAKEAYKASADFVTEANAIVALMTERRGQLRRT